MAAKTMNIAGAGTSSDATARAQRNRPVDRRPRLQRGRRALPPCTPGIAEIARRLKETLPARRPRSSMSTTAAATTRSRSPRALPADALDVQVVSLSRNFGKEAALLAGLDHARFGAVLFMDGDGQHPPTLVETLVGHWLDDGYDVVYTAKANRENEPLPAPAVGARLLRAAQLGRAAQDSGGRRRLPPALAARRRGAQADAGAQPLLQRPGELDRLPPAPRRLRAGRAQPRHRPPGMCSR